MSANKKGRIRHIPQRRCIVCRTTGDKRALTRLVRVPDNGIQLDPTGKLAGRGAYLCSNPACWTTAIKTDVVGKALNTTLTDADRQRLAEAAPTENTEDLA